MQQKLWVKLYFAAFVLQYLLLEHEDANFLAGQKVWDRVKNEFDYLAELSDFGKLIDAASKLFETVDVTGIVVVYLNYWSTITPHLMHFLHLLATGAFRSFAIMQV